MEDDEIIICSNCYEENKKGNKNCWNCGERLFYNDGVELQEYGDNELEYFDEDVFDNHLEFNRNIMAINKQEQNIYFFFDEVLERKINFKNIVECQIIKDSKTMESGGVGRAIVGGLIAGRSRCCCRSYN